MSLRPFGFLVLLLLFLGAPSAVRAQIDSVRYEVATSLQASIQGETPFWHYANTRGRRRPGSTADGLLEGGVHVPVQWDNGLGATLGTRLVGRLSDAHNTLHVLDLYGTLQYRGLRLSVGRFPDTVGTTWHELSMGSMIMSRNAPSIPRIKLSIPHYLDVPWTRGHLQFRGFWSDGRLGSQRSVPRPLLHQKSFYLKINVGAFAAIAGASQNSIWGGEGQSQEWIDYLRLVSGSQTGTEADQNRVGNSIGAYDFALQYAFDNWVLRASRLFYLEDTVSARLRSPWDGMWGLGLRRTEGRGWIDGLLYEHMNTIQQDALPGAPRGRAGYYNHFLFESGWTYEDAVLGTPLLVFTPSQNEVTNNMVIAHHLGVEGAPTPRLDYTLRLTYSRNYGVCEDQIITGTCRVLSYDPAPSDQEVRPRSELREDQYSVGVEVAYRISDTYGVTLLGGAAADLGAFYEDRWGLQAGVRWGGTLPSPTSN